MRRSSSFDLRFTVSDARRSRLVALVGAMEAQRLFTQTSGFPLDPSKMLPAADVLLLVDDEDGSAMLFRYTAHGDLAGDTWHPTSDDAQQQAAAEYGDALGPWMPVPDEVVDPHDFAVRYAHERLDSR